MSNNQIQKLHSLISKGKWNFILFRGVIAWGLMTSVLFTLIQYFLNDRQYPSHMWSYFIVFPIGGFAWGHFMWIYFNNKYQSLDSDEL